MLEDHQLGVTTTKYPSNLLTTYSCAGYPRWTMEERQLGVTTTNGIQVFLQFVAVPVN